MSALKASWHISFLATLKAQILASASTEKGLLFLTRLNNQVIAKHYYDELAKI